VRAFEILYPSSSEKSARSCALLRVYEWSNFLRIIRGNRYAAFEPDSGSDSD
jgi:hypothetical protein